MREIKFRGKRVDNGEWVYGYYSACIERGDNGGVECYYRENETVLHYISDLEGNVHLVDPSTVGQYTGIKDKNGKEIYEGDVLDCQDRIVYVEWNDPCGAWDSKFIKYVREVYSSGIDNANWKYRATVIGNIHDNPELLEV